MNIIINDIKAFKKAFSIVSKVVNKGAMTILECIKFKVGERVLLMGTDLDTWVMIDITDHVTVHKKGDIVIPAKVFGDYLKAQKKGMNITVEEDHWIRINGTRLIGLPPEDYPHTPSIKKGKHYVIENLSHHINTTAYARGESDTKYTLNGLLINFHHREIVGTDGHRLAVSPFKPRSGRKPAYTSKNSNSWKIIQPAVCNILHKIPGNPDVIFDDNMCFFVFGPIQIISRTVNGDYPQYNQVIPKQKDIKTIITVKRQDLLDTIENLLPIAKRKGRTYYGISMHADKETGKMFMHVLNKGVGEQEVTIPCTMQSDQPCITTGFDPIYLKEIITIIDDDTINIHCRESVPHKECLHAFIITGKKKSLDTHVIMPLRGKGRYLKPAPEEEKEPVGV